MDLDNDGSSLHKPESLVVILCQRPFAFHLVIVDNNIFYCGRTFRKCCFCDLSDIVEKCLIFT